jgi:hypothetical protein
MVLGDLEPMKKSVSEQVGDLGKDSQK